MAQLERGGKETRESWAMAALDAMSEGGVEAVAVEPLAKRLGVTKGSFYWHFGSRADLLSAALELWERKGTQEIIAALAPIKDPAERLRHLFRLVAKGSHSDATHAALSAAREPSVRLTLRRVASARLGFLAECYRELGMAPARARRQAFLAYAAYLGMLQLAVDAPGEMRAAAERDAYVEQMFDALVSTKPRVHGVARSK
jgi:AcrR family transcriptional regulator